MPKVFDTHVHYNLPPFVDDWEMYQQAAQNAGVSHAVIVGTNLDSSAGGLELRQVKPDYFRASVGFHPDVITQAIIENDYFFGTVAYTGLTLLADLDDLIRGREYDAWGEIGLDFYRLKAHEHRSDMIRLGQYEFFLRHLERACLDDKPIIFHVRDDADRVDDPQGAYMMLIDSVERCAADKTLIFHCFSGSEAYLRRILALPHSFVSFAGNVTFKSAHNLRALAGMVPSERLLIETDAPYLSPEPVRGQKCQPEFIVHTAQFLQENLNVDLEQVYQNSLAIFGINEL